MKNAIAAGSPPRILALYAATLVAAAAALAATPARSQEAAMQRVSFADLDIGHARGAEVLYARLSSAAHRVCGYPNGVGARNSRAARACYRQALEDAVARVNAPELTALYRRQRVEG